MIADTLPANARLVQQHVRCGKPGRKCARGELHGPYTYATWWESGKRRNKYVPKNELGAVPQRLEAVHETAPAGGSPSGLRAERGAGREIDMGRFTELAWEMRHVVNAKPSYHRGAIPDTYRCELGHLSRCYTVRKSLPHASQSRSRPP